VSLDVDIDVDTKRAMVILENIEDRAEDLRPVFEKARERLELANRANFTENGLPVGGWSPRSRDYAWPIMRRTGKKLFRSLTDLRGAPNEITPRSAQFGTDVEYATFHQTGTRNMPARVVVHEPVGFSQWIAEEIENHVVGLRRVR
jgi:phage gpG-like protein